VNPSAIDIRRYSYSSLDHFLLDTNIWLAVHGPEPARDWSTDIYSAALRDMNKRGCGIWVDVVVLSEFINAYVRKEYDRICDKLPDERLRGFKAIRNTPQFKQVAEEVAAAARTILKVATPCATGFEQADIDAVLSDFGACRLDFNDRVLVELCKARSFTLVTHDVDFRDSGVTVLTANRRLLD